MSPLAQHMTPFWPRRAEGRRESCIHTLEISCVVSLVWKKVQSCYHDWYLIYFSVHKYLFAETFPTFESVKTPLKGSKLSNGEAKHEIPT